MVNMSANSNKRDSRKAYKDLPMLILLDEYTKLDVNKLIADFELLKEKDTLAFSLLCESEKQKTNDSTINIGHGVI